MLPVDTDSSTVSVNSQKGDTISHVLRLCVFYLSPSMFWVHPSYRRGGSFLSIVVVIDSSGAWACSVVLGLF